jgi:CRP/FNR family transcriptional regulator, cyclic AMP receptor protein
VRLDEGDRRDLAALGRPRRYPSGGVLFAQGERTSHVLILTGGRVKVFCTTEDGREPVLGLRGVGELVGELAALDDHYEGGRTSTVVAMEPVTAQEISGADFRAYLAAHPAAAMELLRMVVGRLRSADRRRIEFGGFETTSRLAHLLAELADESGDPTENAREIPFSQAELAAMVGASRESVARALARLRADGLVESRRRGVALLDVAALRRHGR